MNTRRNSPHSAARNLWIKLCSAGLAFLLTTGLAVIGWLAFPDLFKKDW